MVRYKLIAVLVTIAFFASWVGSQTYMPAGGGTGSGTVTSIATTSPITGGTITATGTIACATCTTNASALTNNVVVKGAGSQATQVSLITDDGTAATYTGTGGYKAPVFVATGTTAGFSDYPQGTTSSAVAPCNTATSICFQAPTSVTSQLRTYAGTPATGYTLWTNTAGSMVETLTGTTGTGNVVQASSPTITTPNIVEPMTVNGMAQYAVLTSDFTTPAASGTGLLAITGLSFTLTASTAQNIPFLCHLSYSQATNVADALGLGVSVAATRIDGVGEAGTSTTAKKSGNIAITTSTTATNIVGWTPTVTSVLPVWASGIIQNPSTTSSTLQFYSSQATQADVIVWKAGSWCRLW